MVDSSLRALGEGEDLTKNRTVKLCGEEEQVRGENRGALLAKGTAPAKVPSLMCSGIKRLG